MSGHFGEQRVIVGDVDDHRDVGMVLGRRADHRGAADVDILDHVVEFGAARQRRLERVEIDHQEVDRADGVGDHRGLMGGLGADRQQAAMDARMQGLQPPVHHFGKFGELGDVDHGDARLRQRRSRAAGRDDLDAARRERARQPLQPGLVGNGNEGAADRRHICGHGVNS